MDISSYTSYFHDGEVLGIIQKEDYIMMYLKSAEINPNIINDIPLSVDNRLKGNLHIKGVKSIFNNGEELEGELQMLFPDNDLLHLKIKGNTVFCEIGWRGRNSNEIDFSDLEIRATEVWWENLPS